MTISSLLRVVPSEQTVREPVVRVINRSVYFSGECDRCRPHCGAVCCTGYGFVSLSEEEARSGRYACKEESADCDCPLCRQMREAGVKFILLKQQDGSCIYLDGERRCSIYEDRPEVCRGYSCRNVPFRIHVS